MNIKKILTIFCALVFVYVVVGSYLMRNKRMPQRSKLMNLTADTNSVRFVCPDAIKVRVVLGVEPKLGQPDMNRVFPDVTGCIEFSHLGAIVKRFDITSESLTPCSWLNNGELQLDGLIIGFDEDDLMSYLKANEDHEVSVIFDGKPQEIVSLWLCSLQTMKQIKANKSQHPTVSS